MIVEVWGVEEFMRKVVGAKFGFRMVGFPYYRFVWKEPMEGDHENVGEL